MRAGPAGLGITALIAGFMFGMAGNVSAFATVWTYDIYGAFVRKGASDSHYVRVGRWCTLIGVLISIGTAYLVMQFLSIMDYVQAFVQFLHRPAVRHLVAGHALETRDTRGGFLGAAGGDAVVCGYVAMGEAEPGGARIIALSPNARTWPRTCTAHSGHGSFVFW